MFQPNLNPVSNKSHRKRKPEPNFEPKIKRDKAMFCKHNRNLDITYGEIYCTKCNAIYDSWFVNGEEQEKVKNANIVVWNRNYDKSRWTTYSLDTMLGKNNYELTDQCWLELIREVPDPFTWYQVYKVFQKYQLLKYWIAFGCYIGMRPKLNRKVMNHFAKYMEIGHGKYAISYYYLLYKFVQLWGNPGDERLIPLKNSVTWVRKTDIWWKEICIKEGWEFKPTKIYKIEWNKEEYLKKFAYSVKKYIEDSLQIYDNGPDSIRTFQ